MIGDLLDPAHLIIILIIALLIFGPRRLPELGGAIGKTIREFQHSMKAVTQPDQTPGASQPANPANPDNQDGKS
jgi:sec-independent protein translocase protein TatA